MSVDSKDSSLPPSDFPQGTNSFEAFLDRNQKGVAALAILLVVGAIGLVIYRGIDSAREQSAGAALTKATDPASYQAVISGNGGTEAAGSAMVLLADGQWTAGKQDEAIGTLRKFIADFPKHAAVPSAKASLGSRLMAQGKSGEAVKVLEDVAADPAARFIAPFALVSLGDISRDGGDLAKAETLYNKVKNDFPGSEFADNASRRLAGLKTKPPAEIDPPPAPPAPTAPSLTPETGSVIPGGVVPPGFQPIPAEDAAPAPPVEAPVEVPAPAAPTPVEPPQEAPPAAGSDTPESPAAPVKP